MTIRGLIFEAENKVAFGDVKTEPLAADQVGFGTCRGERKANAARGLDDPGGDFQETKTQGCELGSGQFPDFGNGVAHGQHQPISGRMKHETDLVGER